MNDPHITKWDNNAATFDLFNAGIERRYGEVKRQHFAKATGKTFLIAAGTGSDFQYLPPGLKVTAADFSPKMVELAKEKAKDYDGTIEVVQADVTSLPYEYASFDTIITSCAFCSVPNPIAGLKELHRILKPDGRMFMFEHVRATNPLLGFMMDILTPITRKFGPELNRNTAANVRKAGFTIDREFNVYLDMVKLYTAIK